MLRQVVPASVVRQMRSGPGAASVPDWQIQAIEPSAGKALSDALASRAAPIPPGSEICLQVSENGCGGRLLAPNWKSCPKPTTTSAMAATAASVPSARLRQPLGGVGD